MEIMRQEKQIMGRSLIFCQSYAYIRRQNNCLPGQMWFFPNVHVNKCRIWKGFLQNCDHQQPTRHQIHCIQQFGVGGYNYTENILFLEINAGQIYFNMCWYIYIYIYRTSNNAGQIYFNMCWYIYITSNNNIFYNNFKFLIGKYLMCFMIIHTYYAYGHNTCFINSVMSS